MRYRIPTVAASVVSIGFGLWHFFVPSIWKWYSYMDPKATELVVAVRATNVFFSLSLVLFGLMSIMIVSSKRSSQHTLVTVLAVDVVLWLTRVLLQIIYPQGTISFYLRYGMLSAFVLILALYSVSLLRVLASRTERD